MQDGSPGRGCAGKMASATSSQSRRQPDMSEAYHFPSLPSFLLFPTLPQSQVVVDG
jgi:hypothetical protein